MWKKHKVTLSILVLAELFVLPYGARAGLPEIHGFAEVDYGIKVSDDQTKHDSYNLLEQRLQLKSTYFFEGDNYLSDSGGFISFKGDFTVDGYYGAKTGFELREMSLSFTPFDIMDVKLGRQTLTWGVGDYLFINDLFPKDYESFFIGRDDEYLKKPSDAIKMSFYPKGVNLDFIIIPYFTPNTIAKGDRLSFFDPFQGGIAGRDSERQILSPAFQMENTEYALRLYRPWGSKEVAFYFFHGFDKNPRSYKNEALRQLYYERIDAYGASIRGPFLKGIGSMEGGYYNSREDPDGTNRLIENSFLKGLIGYQKDLGNDLTVGLQYFYEQRLDYDAYKAGLLPQDYFWDEHRHLFTVRLTKLLLNQTLRLSLFNFYSPSDDDGYARPSLDYDINDNWGVTFGANLPWGEDDTTEFGQMKRNKNIYFRVGYHF